MTSKHSTQLNLLEPTLSVGASLASRGRSQTLSEEAQKMTAISGRKCSELLKLLGHGSLLEKMCEALLMSPWGSSVASLTWKILATKTRLSLFQLSPSMRSIAGTECFLWRSPDTGAGGTSGLLKKGVNIRENGQPIQIRLVDQVNNPRLWPTPTGQDNPQVRGEGKTVGTKRGTTLGGAVRLWPTPRASEWKGVGPLGSKSHKHRVKKGYLDATVQEVGQVTGQLNPNWVEWLQGYPIGWTDLNVSGIASSLLSQCTLDEPSSRPADD